MGMQVYCKYIQKSKCNKYKDENVMYGKYKEAKNLNNSGGFKLDISIRPHIHLIIFFI